VVVGGEQMVFRAFVLQEFLEHVSLARRLESMPAHRHPTVPGDHDEVEREAEEEQRHPCDPEVHRREEQEQHERGGEHRHPDEKVGAVPTVRERECLERESDRGQCPHAEP
jgi:hypothetical protein